ncbi:tRNA (adenosine(37)-N6)-threonylcarbamoyltransferase complex dimerization subunit type 1 TsaB [Agriterribacter sp.]|uniref:tRNA (adenosine(37)-N6)-threonylcarbamoyltransferase complex dimerization subunit type 1 TsaB n=1 Tax=Agriterribacter sp. TaxID=2821509 RepID=UPI002BAD1369|nr:tRNA (adenosine(37)-N6)-threonylcarbamoyltransferase complex dimerization subunit type 1 TsaB [Agriterribacter sp.]HRP56932.1 tRNA (adenosine(37)-N6)-threonylcarbamoyltransferase complex dimerization subunit type 1 TsaB [Agriterribacter sp.]
MAMLLHIDTALEKSFVGLACDGLLLMELSNTVQHDHAAFVQPAIRQIMDKCGVSMNDIDAVGVTIGPGSYTGLRVGMASAKGICYALSKPLVAITTTEAMTAAAIEAFPGFDAYCPMIDARRDEVYAALYEPTMKVVLPPHAIVLTVDFFAQELEHKKILFFGTGAAKWKQMPVFNAKASFEKTEYKGKHLACLFHNSFKNNLFCDLAYTEPLYAKNVHFAGGKNGK